MIKNNLFEQTKQLNSGYFDSNFRMLKEMCDIIVKNFITEDEEFKQTSISSSNNYYETGPGGMYSIMRKEESYKRGSEKLAYTVNLYENVDETPGGSKSFSYSLNCTDLPNNQYFNITIEQRNNIKIKAELDDSGLTLLNKYFGLLK